jgi:hypothetical protein
MKANLEVKFPQGRIYLKETSQTLKGGIVKIKIKPYFEPNAMYQKYFNNNLDKTQIFLDNKVIIALQRYVSKKYGVQEMSIRVGSDPGSGFVNINVPYARYQAYSKRIRKRVGLRGTQPFERMSADNKDSILRQVAEYSRRIQK